MQYVLDSSTREAAAAAEAEKRKEKQLCRNIISRLDTLLKWIVRVESLPCSRLFFCFYLVVFFLCIFNNFLGISWAATAFLFGTHKYVFIYAKLFIYARDFDDWWMGETHLAHELFTHI